MHDKINSTVSLTVDLKAIHGWSIKWKMVFMQINPLNIIFTHRNYTSYNTSQNMMLCLLQLALF